MNSIENFPSPKKEASSFSEMSRKRQSRLATDHPPLPVSMALAFDNHDLLMQILLFLPAKSLIRFKSICKKWLSLISSDHFCHHHTLRRPKLQQSIIIQMQSEQLFYLNETTNGKNAIIPYSLSVLDRHQIVQACHGLMLLESKHRKNSYYVYNPTTRRLRKISLAKKVDFPYVVAITLAFEPSKSPYYKVVCFRSTVAQSNPAYYGYHFEIYDSESHTWKLSSKGSTYIEIDYNSGLYWNNCIFWRILAGHYFCLNIDKNEVTKVRFSKYPYDLYENTLNFLRESNGHLYCFVLLKSAQSALPIGGVVWEVRGDDHSQLSQKYLGRLHQHPGMAIINERLMVRSGGDGSTCSLLTYETRRRRIMAYNYLDRGSQLLLDLTNQSVSKFDQVTKAFQFGEILALV